MRLEDFPHPSVAVDVALVTVVEGGLAVAVHERTGHAAGRYALPGTFVRIDETLAGAALRTLEETFGITGRAPEQVRVFDDPARDDRGRVLGLAHVDLVPTEVLAEAVARGRAVLAPVHGDRVVLPAGHDALAFDHDAMVAAALHRVRERHRREPDPAGLLGEEFTLAALQALHEAVLGAPLVKDTFRRRMLDDLAGTGEVRAGVVGKPARLFRRTAAGAESNAGRHPPPGRGTH